MPVVPSRHDKARAKLIIILAGLFLVSCSHVPPMNTSGRADSQKKTETAQKAREAEPQPESQPLPKLSSSAEGAGRKWIGYMRDDDGTEYFYDRDALIQSSTGFIQMWRKREFPSGAAQKEIVTLDEIDCRKGRYRTLELRVTYWDSRKGTSDKATGWTEIYQDSTEEYLMDEHCARNPAL
jgi:hypothetical protein